MIDRDRRINLQKAIEEMSKKAKILLLLMQDKQLLPEELNQRLYAEEFWGLRKFWPGQRLVECLNAPEINLN